MDGWINGWLDGWMDRQINEKTHDNIENEGEINRNLRKFRYT